MTTVVNPGGSPTVVFNLSGITVVSVATSASPVAIPYYSGVIIALITTSAEEGDGEVILPSSAQVGDVVEIYNATPTVHAVNVDVPEGQSFLAGSVGTLSFAGYFRMLPGGSWGVIGLT